MDSKRRRPCGHKSAPIRKQAQRIRHKTGAHGGTKEKNPCSNKNSTMKSKLFFLLLFLTTQLHAQTKNENAVARSVEQLRLAMISADSTKLANLVAEQLSYGHSSGAVDDKKLFIEKIVNGRSDFVHIALSEQSITISGKTAIVRHILKATTNDGGKPGEVNLRVLLVWQKQGRNWKLLARQAVKMN